MLTVVILEYIAKADAFISTQSALADPTLLVI